MGRAQAVAAPEPPVMGQADQIDLRAVPVGAAQADAMIGHGHRPGTPADKPGHDRMAEGAYPLVAGIRRCIQKE